MIKCPSSGEPLNNTGRVYLKKLKLSRIANAADENQHCPTSQYRTIRRVLARSKDKSRPLVGSPYLEQSYLPTKKHNKSVECRVKPQKVGVSDPDEEPGTTRVEVQYRGQRFIIVVHSHTSGEVVATVKRELLARAIATKENLPEFLRIIGFESIGAEKQLDYILSLEHVELNRNSYSLRPLLYSRISDRISFSDFSLVKCLGSGGFSQVFLVRGRFNNRYYAMKLMNKKFIVDNERESIVENQRFIMEAARHPFLVELFYAFETENYFAFIMEYCSGGELFYRLKKIKRMTEDEAKFYFVEILLGIKYLHENKIIYRDIKPENLLIGQDGHTRIADFGLAKPHIDSKTVSYSFCGSPQYMAPEMLTRAGHSFTIDYYCVGALLYELVTGLPPFYSKDHEEIYNSILNEQLAFPAHVDLSPEIKSLLRGLLDKNPKLRLGSYRGVAEILIHPWIGRLDRADVLAKKLKPPFVPDPYSFNFDGNELEGEIREVFKKVLHEQSNPQHFEPHFSEKFTFQAKKDQAEQELLHQYKTFKDSKVKLQCKSVRHTSLQKTRSVQRLQLQRMPLKQLGQADRRLYNVASHRQY